MLLLPDNEKLSLGLLSSDGRFKRLPIEEVIDLSGRAMTILKLKEGVSLKSAVICHPNGEVVIVSSLGRVLKLDITNETIPLMGKLAQGPLMMKTLPGEIIVGAVSTPNDSQNQIVIATKYGKIKKINLNSIRRCQKGDLGEMSITLKDSKKYSDRVIDVYNGSQLGSVISSKGRNARIASKELDNFSNYKNNPLNLKEEEFIKKVIPLIIPETYL